MAHFGTITGNARRKIGAGKKCYTRLAISWYDQGVKIGGTRREFAGREAAAVRHSPGLTVGKAARFAS